MTLPPNNPKSKPSPVVREPLRWLFAAWFEDGSEIVQDQEDKCYTRTDGTGSTYTDVLAKDGLVGFALISTDGKQHVSVDLKTGAFIVNDTPLHIHNQLFEPQNHKLELVYFRETRIDQQINGKGKQVSASHYVNRYFIGWKTKVHGKDKQVTIAVG